MKNSLIGSYDKSVGIIITDGYPNDSVPRLDGTDEYLDGKFIYDISGSANWFNKCDNAITVHRHRSEDEDYVGIHVHKIRFQYKNGRPGMGKLSYDIKGGGRYVEYQEEPKEALFD